MVAARMNRLLEYRPFRKLNLAGYSFGLSRQCLVMRDMETLLGFIYEALPGQFPNNSQTAKNSLRIGLSQNSNSEQRFDSVCHVLTAG